MLALMLKVKTGKTSTPEWFSYSQMYQELHWLWRNIKFRAFDKDAQWIWVFMHHCNLVDIWKQIYNVIKKRIGEKCINVHVVIASTAAIFHIPWKNMKFSARQSTQVCLNTSTSSIRGEITDISTTCFDLVGLFWQLRSSLRRMIHILISFSLWRERQNRATFSPVHSFNVEISDIEWTIEE